MNSDSLDPQLVLELLGYLADDNVVLVGGQSVMFWAHHYQLLNQHESFTTDIDLFGNSADIESADARLIAVHHETKYAELDDSSPNSGVILINATGRAKVRVVYLWSVYGLAGSDIQERSVPLKMSGFKHALRVLHPLMCLESKVANIGAFPLKRDAFGVKQADLSIQIARSYVEGLLQQQRQRDALNAVERIFRIAQMDASSFAWHVFALDVTKAIPPHEKLPDEFGLVRWPQMQQRLDKARMALGKRLPNKPDVSNTLRMRF